MDTVEILMATYNGERYISQQLESIINQSYTDWILRIADDNSKDDTYKILMNYQQKYPNKILVEKNVPGYGSAKANFMNLLKKSTGKYVMCCDQDDIWLPNKILVTYEMMKTFEKNNKPVLIHTDLKVVDAELNVMSESFFEYSKFRKQYELKDNFIQNFVTGCTMMLNRELVDMLKELDACSDILMHDWAASLIATTFGYVGFVDEPTMLYRQHGVNSVGAKQYGVPLFIETLKENRMKEAVENTCNQAAYLLKKYGCKMNNMQLELYTEYSNAFKVSKVKRIKTYFKRDIWKNGFARKICQIIFC